MSFMKYDKNEKFEEPTTTLLVGYLLNVLSKILIKSYR